MKIFLTAAAFVFAVIISSTAWAAAWTPIDTGDEGTKVYVDKSSIRRGVRCAALGINRADGFTANIKLEMAMPGDKPFVMINTMGFFTDNGSKKKCYIAPIDEDGKPAQDASIKPEVSDADGNDGTIWPKVYDYLQKNVP